PLFPHTPLFRSAAEGPTGPGPGPVPADHGPAAYDGYGGYGGYDGYDGVADAGPAATGLDTTTDPHGSGT
ncbi:hypothetical protein ACWEPM_37065, partial [Streptomyces sp. NPDC004244]